MIVTHIQAESELLAVVANCGRYRLGGRARVACTIRVDVERPGRAFDHFLGDHNLLHPFQARQIEHSVEQDALHDRTQAPCASLAVDRFAGDGPKGLFGEGQVNRLHLEQPLVLFDQCIFGLGQDFLERGFVQIFQRRYYR
jgi:hypothetical protein